MSLLSTLWAPICSLSSAASSVDRSFVGVKGTSSALMVRREKRRLILVGVKSFLLGGFCRGFSSGFSEDFSKGFSTGSSPVGLLSSVSFGLDKVAVATLELVRRFGENGFCYLRGEQPRCGAREMVARSPGQLAPWV